MRRCWRWRWWWLLGRWTGWRSRWKGRRACECQLLASERGHATVIRDRGHCNRTRTHDQLCWVTAGPAVNLELSSSARQPQSHLRVASRMPLRNQARHIHLIPTVRLIDIRLSEATFKLPRSVGPRHSTIRPAFRACRADDDDAWSGHRADIHSEYRLPNLSSAAEVRQSKLEDCR